MGYGSRLPTSNEPPRPIKEKRKWLGDNEYLDEFALVLNGLTKRCTKCGGKTHVDYLKDGLCPDCR